MAQQQPQTKTVPTQTHRTIRIAGLTGQYGMTGVRFDNDHIATNVPAVVLAELEAHFGQAQIEILD